MGAEYLDSGVGFHLLLLLLIFVEAFLRNHFVRRLSIWAQTELEEAQMALCEVHLHLNQLVKYFIIMKESLYWH